MNAPQQIALGTMVAERDDKALVLHEVFASGEHPEFGKFELTRFMGALGFRIHLARGDVTYMVRIGARDIMDTIFEAIEHETREGGE